MRLRTTLLASFICAVACSSDRTTAPSGTVLTDSQVNADLAVSAGNASAMLIQDQNDYVDGMRVGANAAPPPALGSSGTSAAASHPTCTYAASTGRWTCTPFVDARGMTVTRSYGYLDVTDNAMQAYDPTLTARVNYETNMSGPVGNGGSFTGVSHRSISETMSGLAGQETMRVWDVAGISADTTSHTNSAGARHYAGVRLDTLKSVTFTFPHTPGSYPISGQAIQIANFTVTSTGKTTETRSVSRRIVTTFNGTATATVAVGNLTCNVHLDTRSVDGCY